MAYQNTTLTDLDSMLSTMGTFAASNGWTVTTDGVTGGTKSITLSYSGSTYVSLIHSGSYIYMNGHRSYTSSTAYNAQTGQFFSSGDLPTYCRSYFSTTTITSVHLFAGTSPAPYIYAAVEISAGYYRHFVVGQLDKAGSYTGGIFFDCVDIDDSTGYVYSTYWERNRYPLVWNDTYQAAPRKGGIDADDGAGGAAWYSFASSTTWDRAGVIAADVLQVVETSPVQFSQVSQLHTPILYCKPLNYVPAGSVPNMCYVSMENYNAGDEVTLGSDTWKVFPAIRKLNYRYSGGSYSHSSANESSHNIGIAYKK